MRIRGDRGVARVVECPGDARDGPDRRSRPRAPRRSRARRRCGPPRRRGPRCRCARRPARVRPGRERRRDVAPTAPGRADSSASYCPGKAVCALRPDDEEAPWCRCDGGCRPRRRRDGLADRRESEPALDHGSAGVQARAPEIRFLLPDEEVAGPVERNGRMLVRESASPSEERSIARDTVCVAALRWPCPEEQRGRAEQLDRESQGRPSHGTPPRGGPRECAEPRSSPSTHQHGLERRRAVPAAPGAGRLVVRLVAEELDRDAGRG